MGPRTRLGFLCAPLTFACLLASPLAVARPGDPPPDDLITHASLGARIGEPVAAGSLVFYPVTLAPEMRASLGLVTVAQALRQGTFQLSEVHGGMQQLFLMASNTGGRGVFGQGGSFYQGGGQDRGGGRGFVMAPLSESQVPVFCFEEGRMQGPTDRFSPDVCTLAHPTLRGLIALGDQRAIWSEIRRQREVLGVDPAGSTSYRTVDGARIVAEGRRYAERIDQPLGLGPSGFVVACGDRIVGMDLYADTGLFRDMRGLLLASYAMVNAEVGPEVPCTVGPAGVAAFLWDVANARRDPRGSVDLEDGVWLRFGCHAGEAVAYKGSLVHLGVYDTRPPVY